MNQQQNNDCLYNCGHHFPANFCCECGVKLPNASRGVTDYCMDCEPELMAIYFDWYQTPVEKIQELPSKTSHREGLHAIDFQVSA